MSVNNFIKFFVIENSLNWFLKHAEFVKSMLQWYQEFPLNKFALAMAGAKEEKFDQYLCCSSCLPRARILLCLDSL